MSSPNKMKHENTSMSIFARLAAAHRAKTLATAAENGPVTPLFATTKVAESRESQRKRDVAATDVLDAHRHAFLATVLACNKHPNPKCAGMSEIVVAVTSVEANDSPVIATSPHTGNTFLFATAKDPPPGGQKIKLPRYISPECSAVRIDGVVKMSISNGRNGFRGGDFKPEDVPVGSHVRLTAVNLNYNLVNPSSVDSSTPVGAVYLECEAIEVLSKPQFPTENNTAAFNAVLCESPGALFQAAIDADAEIGGINANLTAIATKDRFFLAGFLKEMLESYKDSKVGVGEVYERDVVGCTASVEKAIYMLGNPENVVNDPIQLFPLDSVNTRCPMFLQHCPGVVTKALMGYAGSGFGPLCTLRNETFNSCGEGVDGFAVSEMTLTPRDERVDGAVPVLSKPIKFDITTGITARSEIGNSFEPSIATLDECALATHLPLYTTKRLKDDFGVFDVGRLHDVALEVMPHANVVFFPKIEMRAESVFQFPILAPDGEWGRERSIIDVVPAIADIGVKVSKEFVKCALVDDDDQFIKPNMELFASDHHDGASKMQKKAPTLETAGFVALNSGKLERSFTALLKRLPEGSAGVDFHVVFPGVSDLHDETSKLNVDEAAGDALLKAMHPSKKSLNAFIVNKTVVYAIAKSKKRSRDDVASSSEDVKSKKRSRDDMASSSDDTALP